MPEFESSTNPPTGTSDAPDRGESGDSVPPIAPHSARPAHYEPSKSRTARQRDGSIRIEDPRKQHAPPRRPRPNTRYQAQPGFFARLYYTVQAFFSRLSAKPKAKSKSATRTTRAPSTESETGQRSQRRRRNRRSGRNRAGGGGQGHGANRKNEASPDSGTPQGNRRGPRRKQGPRQDQGQDHNQGKAAEGAPGGGSRRRRRRSRKPRSSQGGGGNPPDKSGS